MAAAVGVKDIPLRALGISGKFKMMKLKKQVEASEHYG